MARPTDRQYESRDKIHGVLGQAAQIIRQYGPKDADLTLVMNLLMDVQDLMDEFIRPEGWDVETVKVTSPDFGNNLHIDKERGAK